MNWLEEKRRALKLTQKYVAEQVGISQASYCNIESGKRHVTVKTAKKIAAVLGFGWTEFFEEQ